MSLVLAAKRVVDADGERADAWVRIEGDTIAEVGAGGVGSRSCPSSPPQAASSSTAEVSVRQMWRCLDELLMASLPGMSPCRASAVPNRRRAAPEKIS